MGERQQKRSLPDGYQPGNLWERMLETHIHETQPDLPKQFGKEFKDFLTFTASDAIDQMAEMIQQGMEPRTAREIAQREMLEEIDHLNETIPQETGDTPGEISSAAD